VQSLEPPNLFYFSAAMGWLELGNPIEAKSELARIEPALRNHPDVLELSWAIHAHTQDWHIALETARALLQCDPHRCTGWLHQAYALRRVPEGGLEAAWEALYPALDGFPSDPTVPYNLACYACQLGQLAEARKLIEEAINRGDKRTIKQMALNDPDLAPLRELIPKLCS
jgi:tetratricopeptide (TPR) repeat protein